MDGVAESIAVTSEGGSIEIAWGKDPCI